IQILTVKTLSILIV
ncbi:putative inner membrane protein oxaA, partial [Chlamydia psittaci 03DC29]